MIQRPDNLISIPVDFLFNSLTIAEVEIDLNHINSGSGKAKRRSDFKAKTVAEICELFFSNQKLAAVGEQVFDEEICRYFKVIGVYKNKYYRMIICHCTDKPNTLGVMTLFKENK